MYRLLRQWVDYKYHTALSILSLFIYTGTLFGSWDRSLACLLFLAVHLFYLWGSGRMFGRDKSKLFRFLLWVELGLATYLLLQFDGVQILNFVLLGLIALSYYKPIFWVRFRYVPGVKAFWVALLWAGVLYQLFFLSKPPQLDFLSWEVLSHFLSIYFLILAITIPFDIRDLDSDAAASLKTLPQFFGVTFAKRFALLCLLISEVLRCYVMLNFKGLFFYTLSFAFVGYAFLIIYFSGTSRRGRYYSFGVEFTPVVLSINFLLIEYLLSV